MATPGDMRSFEERVTAVVAEMVALGAVFTISDAGPTGEARWHWRPQPEIMRNAIRKYWTSVEDRSAPGFTAAMVRAIKDLNRGGGDVQ